MKLLHRVWRGVKPYCTLKMLPIALTLWCITNGWAYALAVVPNIPLWLRSITIGYIAILYMPFTLEKVVIIVFAPIIYRWIYKEDFIKGEIENDNERRNT